MTEKTPKYFTQKSTFFLSSQKYLQNLGFAGTQSERDFLFLQILQIFYKILDKDILITATTVRIPIERGHCESVNLRLSEDFEIKEIVNILNNSEGVVVFDNIEKNEYPMPINVSGSDDVYVGRIRRDFSEEKSLNMWVAADNLRKGAATNTVQIAEYMIKNKLI